MMKSRGIRVPSVQTPNTHIRVNKPVSVRNVASETKLPVSYSSNVMVGRKSRSGISTEMQTTKLRVAPMVPKRFFSEAQAAPAEIIEEFRNTEKPTGPSQQLEFQAETRKLLDIVARSLYSEKEVFIRELISNASDALEKLRYLKLTGGAVDNKESPMEINLYTDTKKKTLTIQDGGIGMSKDDLVNNLGRIGRSGSAEFFKNLQDKSSADIIGQFGVGFYSVFMVGDEVTVFSKSAQPGSKGYCWKSDGRGTYEISEAEGVSVGTKIVIRLNSLNEDFCVKEIVERVIKRYSNFVGFPIKLNNDTVNTVKPLWTMAKKDIKPEDHKEFYQFIAHAYDEPMFHLHYTTDSPINIRSLFYIGHQHQEKYGMGRMDPGVSLFSKKVLIQAKAKNILPDFLRFVKGVVDSEDLPLNLSREHLQDSALVRRISNVLTKRILKWIDEESKKDPEKYMSFWEEYGTFIREGVCSDLSNKEEIAKLLRSETSTLSAGKISSLEEYVSRMPSDQQEIFYLCAPDRMSAEASPYYEAFKAKNKEVLFLYNQLDDFVMTNLGEFDKKKLVSIESSKAREALKKDESKEDTDSKERLTKEQMKDFGSWFKEALFPRVASVTESDRLIDSPAIVVDFESASLRRMMKYVDPTRAPELPKQQVEINPKHPVIVELNKIRALQPETAKVIAEQIFDNALAAAGLMDDPRLMVPRINKLLAKALGIEK